MNILGIGPLELLFVLLIGLLVLGPEGMVDAGRKLGKFLRSIVTSGWWKSLQSGVDEMQNLPYRLMREAELEEWNEANIPDDVKSKPSPKDPLQQSSWRGSAPSSPAGDEDREQSQEEEYQETSQEDENGSSG